MKKITVLFFVTLCFLLHSQNTLRLYSEGGELFKVYIRDKVYNTKAQASVVIEKVMQDTFYVKVGADDNNRQGITLYLLNKGKPTKGKEFNYKLSWQGTKIKVRLTGVDSLIIKPDPIVPAPPKLDTSSIYRNTVMGHFCEVKDTKVTYFNNLPSNATCTQAMPNEYMAYIRFLMQNAGLTANRTKVAEDVCRNNCLSVTQLKTLMDYADLELEKLKIARLGYFNLADTANKKILESSFRFASTATELNRFFKNPVRNFKREGEICEVPSPNGSIDALAKQVSAYDNDSRRLEVLKKVGNLYCYNTEQLRLLFKSFIHDREIFESLKFLYPYCVEKNRLPELESLFNVQQSVLDYQEFLKQKK